MSFDIVGKIIGGIGLFFIGIDLMRRGFQAAAGTSLRRIISDYTDTTPRALFAGFLLASAVQSSSAVILTMIGFLNARILRLRQAIVIDYGSNIGKVTTAWLIAMIGLNMSIGTFALPLMGVGFVLKNIIRTRYKGYADSVIGFAVIFLGISFLKESISALATFVDLSHMHLSGFGGTVLSFFIGVVMTMVSQSSAAAITVVLSVSPARIIPIEAASAMLVGLNIGTTFGAYIASLKSGENGRRLAFGHVLYNSTCMLSGLLIFTLAYKTPLNFILYEFYKTNPVTFLAGYYTSFICLSLVIMLPLTNRIDDWLDHHFHDTKALGHPVHFDMQQTGTLDPIYAMECLQREVIRFGRLTTKLLADSLTWQTKNGWVYSHDSGAIESELDNLNDYIHSFAAPYTQTNEENIINRRIQLMCRASQHFELSSDFSHAVSMSKGKLSEKISEETLTKMHVWSEDVVHILDRIDFILDKGDIDHLKDLGENLKAIDKRRREMRSELITEITTGRMVASHATALIDIIETTRRSLREVMRGTYKAWKPFDVSNLSNTSFLEMSFDEETSVKEAPVG